MKRNYAKLLSGLLAVLVLLSCIPLSALAAPAADIPAEMLDNVYLDALAYTGYHVQTQKDDGTIFKKYAGGVAASVRSKIGYGTSASGLETVADPSTKTGLAPNIAKFESAGLCCATYVTYVYYNYLKNVAGIDTSMAPCPSNPRSSSSYSTAANGWVSAGTARRITFTQNGNGGNFKPSETIPLGSLIIFKRIDTGKVAHVAIYAGYYGGQHFVTHVGGDNGPEFCTIAGMSKGGEPEAVAEIVVPSFVEENGAIEIYKKDPNGKPLAGAYFKAVGNGYTYSIGPTNAAGYASLEKVALGDYTVTEVMFPANYTAAGQTSWNVTAGRDNGGIVTIHAVNKLKQGYIEVLKKDAESGKALAGAEFTVYDLSGRELTKLPPTDENGYARSGLLDYGTVVVKETKAPGNYQPGTVNSWTVTIGDDTPTVRLEITNGRQYGSVRVRKTAEDGLTEGLRFRLTGTSVYGESVDLTAVADASGVAVFDAVPIGRDYELSEIDTPARYVIPGVQRLTVQWNTVTDAQMTNLLKKFRVRLQKVDAETGYPQGDGSLDGAVYGLYRNGQLLKTYTTADGGKLLTDFYVCGDGYSLWEITPSEGYQLDPTVYYPQAEADRYTVELNTTDLSSKEPVKKSQIRLIKHADDGSTQIEHPEAGAEFEVYLRAAGSYANARPEERDRLTTDKDGLAISKALPYGVYVVRQVKGDPAYELLPAFEVTIREHAEVYTYILNDAPLQAAVDIVKRDAESGKVIPVAGIGFKVKDLRTGAFITQHISYPTPTDIDIFFTDATGTLRLPEKLRCGEYELIEQCTAYGYVLDAAPVRFSVDGSAATVTVTKYNTAQKGVIRIYKSGEVFSSVREEDGCYIPVYADSGLPGAVFGIYAAEDVYTPDGTLRCKAGEKADTVTTRFDGKAESRPLYLGKYEIREEKAPYGTVLTAEPTLVELTYAGQDVSVTAAVLSVTNKRQKAAVRIGKVLEKDARFSLGENEETESVVFGLYVAEVCNAADGTCIPADGLIETARCTPEGQAVFTADIPVGAKLYIREIAADAHYIVSDAQYPVEFPYAGQNTALVEIRANGGEPVENRLKRGKVTGSKTDEDGRIVSGAVFGLFAENETVFSADTARLTAVSDADGRFVFSDVPYGKWQVRELSAPKPYVLSDTVYPVVVGEDGAVVAIEAVNRYITGSIRIVKRDADTGETLAGAEFALYDGNGTEIARKTTGRDGTAVFEGLRCGSYTVKETKAADGYILSDTVTPVEITEDGQTLTVERTNRRIPKEPESPQTGDSSSALWLALPAGLGSLLTVFGVRRRRRN